MVSYNYIITAHLTPPNTFVRYFKSQIIQSFQTLAIILPHFKWKHLKREKEVPAAQVNTVCQATWKKANSSTNQAHWFCFVIPFHRRSVTGAQWSFQEKNAWWPSGFIYFWKMLHCFCTKHLPLTLTLWDYKVLQL